MIAATSSASSKPTWRSASPIPTSATGFGGSSKTTYRSSMPHRFDPTILREYDIRGIVGDTLHTADAHALGRSFALTLAQAGGRRVAVGYDGRLTSKELEAALVDGLAEGGIDVLRVGLGPTPMLYFAAATLGVDGGIMVTGSHNPPDHNGFKMVLLGKPFFGEAIQRLAKTVE